MLSHSFYKTHHKKCNTIELLHFSFFKNTHFFIGHRSALQTDQLTCTIFLHSYAFVMCAAAGFAWSCWKYMDISGKDVILKAVHVALRARCTFLLASQKCKIPLPRALTQPHTMLISLEGSLPYLECTVLTSLKKNADCLTAIHVYTSWWFILDAA